MHTGQEKEEKGKKKVGILLQKETFVFYYHVLFY